MKSFNKTFSSEDNLKKFKSELTDLISRYNLDPALEQLDVKKETHIAEGQEKHVEEKTTYYVSKDQKKLSFLFLSVSWF